MVLWREIEFVNLPSQVLRHVKVPFKDCPIDGQLCRRCGYLLSSPSLHLPPHWLEIALHTVNANREAVFEGEVLRVSREDGAKVATNNMAKLPFELTVPISRARLKTHRGTVIVES